MQWCIWAPLSHSNCFMDPSATWGGPGDRIFRGCFAVSLSFHPKGRGSSPEGVPTWVGNNYLSPHTPLCGFPPITVKSKNHSNISDTRTSVTTRVPGIFPSHHIVADLLPRHLCPPLLQKYSGTEPPQRIKWISIIIVTYICNPIYSFYAGRNTLLTAKGIHGTKQNKAQQNHTHRTD